MYSVPLFLISSGIQIFFTFGLIILGIFSSLDSLVLDELVFLFRFEHAETTCDPF
jgi:hypothetical protein